MFPKNPSDPSNSVELCTFLARHVPDCRCCMLALFFFTDRFRSLRSTLPLSCHSCLFGPVAYLEWRDILLVIENWFWLCPIVSRFLC